MQSDGSTATMAVIYAAKSTADKAGSIPDQIERCREYAQRQNPEWEVAADYSDEAASAYTGSRGPGLAAAKAQTASLAAQGRDAVLLVFAADRLARGDGGVGRAHLVEHVLDGVKSGYRVESVSENLGGEMAVVFASLYGARAHADSAAKSAHTRRGIAAAARDGRYVGSRRPYGYRFDGERDKRRLVVDDAEAQTIRLMAEWYESGAGDGELAGRLNERGVPSPLGGLWDKSCVRNVLRSPIVAGDVHLNGEVIHGPWHEPILDRERWERLQAIREARRGTGRRPNGGHIFTGGILRCPECRSALRARTTPNGYAAYECPGRYSKDRPVECDQSNIDARLIEGLILDGLLDLVFDPDETRARIEAAAGEERGRAEKYLVTAEKRLRAVERKREKATKEYVGVLSASRLEEVFAVLDQDRAQAEAHAAELREAAAAIEAEASDLDAEREVVGRLQALQALVSGPRRAEDVELLRDALRTTFERVYLVEAGKPGQLVVIPVLRREAVATTGDEQAFTTRDGTYTSRRQTPLRQPLPAALTRRTPQT